MEKENIQCHACGGVEFREGKLDGYAAVRPTGKFLRSSPLILTVCPNCGEVASMRVKKVHIFQD